ncbi:hypothetical protein [Lignipirellula cremea]|uniref:DUF7133 domain-containing protein n=1 Tax=Lignipirellula cremea TaxID=2528010 RepID=A0A518DYA0_9BACT|nr:hypothetical protein [Lignipirellula cremea]QDU96781.1 hypothetical protein Pla8534_46020 [Lignipirellula cremea]
MRCNSMAFTFLATALLCQSLAAEPPTEKDYYPLFDLPIPEGVVLESGGLTLLKNGSLAASSRRGDIYLFSNPFSDDPAEIQATRFASGLHEVLSLTEREGWLYATQRGEVTRMKDTTGDGRADLFQTVTDDWGINGDYHEYAFSSDFDKDGYMWVVLCLTGSFNSNSKYRGWCLRVGPDGETIPTCSGIRSPGGIGMNAEGEVFYTDNQGPWNGTCSLKQLKPGAFMGHPAGNRWFDEHTPIKPPTAEPESGSRLMVEAAKIPELMPPCILFPYKKMGQSASGVACDTTGGKFGPFENQLFVGDQTFSTVMRVFLEKVNGRYQGACFPFREGIASGTLPLCMTPQGAMFIGGTNRGWGSRGGKPFCLQRMTFSGKTPFEVHEMRAKPDGFELTFTQPVDAKTAADVGAYRLPTYTYIYQSSYGSPEVDATEAVIEKAVVASDNKSVRLYVQGMQPGHVHELHLDGVRSVEGLPLLHAEAYYTLNYLPKE